MSTTPSPIRPTRAEVDLGAIAHNVDVLQRAAGKAPVWAMVKANAYGHGLAAVGKHLDDKGIAGLGVATVEEGLTLRSAGVGTQILVFGGPYVAAHGEVLARGLTPVVNEPADVAAFAHAAGSGTAAVHVEIDTGMARLGVPISKVEGMLQAFASAKNVRVAGLFTHFAASEDPNEDGFTHEQLRRFMDVVHAFRAQGHSPLLHAANSGGLWRHPAARLDMVRPGICVYGIPPGSEDYADLRPALRLVSAIAAVREVRVGESVGYNRTFRAKRPSRIATVSVGYGDGYLRSAGNRAFVLVHGQRAPVVGIVSMDLITVDVTDIPAAAIGSEVVLIGTQGDATMGAREVGFAMGTNAYEVLTQLSAARVPRIYTRSVI